MKILLSILFFFVTLYADTSLYSQPYIASTQPHLYETFDYFSDTEPMECDSMFSPTKCSFKTAYDAHFGKVLFILIVAFFLIIGLIGGNSDYDGLDSSGGGY